MLKGSSNCVITGWTIAGVGSADASERLLAGGLAQHRCGGRAAPRDPRPGAPLALDGRALRGESAAGDERRRRRPRPVPDALRNHGTTLRRLPAADSSARQSRPPFHAPRRRLRARRSERERLGASTQLTRLCSRRSVRPASIHYMSLLHTRTALSNPNRTPLQQHPVSLVFSYHFFPPAVYYYKLARFRAEDPEAFQREVSTRQSMSAKRHAYLDAPNNVQKLRTQG